MNKCKSVALTLTPNYVQNWDFCDAIRELIQNGIDQQKVSSESTFKLTYDESEKILQLSSEKTGLEIDTLLLGGTTKSDSDETVGQFGEGYKIAALVLNRIGKTFTVYNNKQNEIWFSEFQESDIFKEKVLTFNIFNHISKSETLVIEVENVEKCEYEDLFSIWLDIPGGAIHKKISTTYGDILTEEDMRGRIFVNGLSVENKSDKYYGYNFKPQYISLERDRKSCDDWDIDSATANMLCEALIEEKLKIKEIMKISNSICFSDMKFLRFGAWNENSQKTEKMIIEEFNKENKDRIAVDTQYDFDRVKEIGGNPVITSMLVSRIMSKNTKEKIEELRKNMLCGDITVKERLKKWCNLYERDLSQEAIEQFYQIIEELE